ncbi:MAG: c-type cytochrome [Rhodoferax sp.]|nr:c-type cytochrome [Rhodoferax sp.]
MRPQSILDIWFKELTAKKHFVNDAAIDETIRARCCDTPVAAARCGRLGITRFFSILIALCLVSLNAVSQEISESRPAETTHRVLLLGGVNLIQDSEQPKIRALYETVGLYVARGLLDNLKANHLEVDSYIPAQRLPKSVFDTDVALAILKCKCTMLLQTTLRAQNGSLQFKFEAMTLRVERNGITPQEKWQLTKVFFATEESLSSAVPSDIVKEVTAELLSKRVFSKRIDAPSLPAPTQESKTITRALMDGRQTYNAICSACHTTGIAGSPRIGDLVAWAPRIALGYTAMLQSAIKGKGVMAPQRGSHLDPVELERAVVYLANQSGAKFAEPQVPPGHPGTHTYTEFPPPARLAKPPAYETLTPDQKLLYGERVYGQNCAACHQKNGEGAGHTPTLRNANTFSENEAVTRAILHGLPKGAMPGWRVLSDNDIAAVINYMRGKFGSDLYQYVQPEDVLRLR